MLAWIEANPVLFSVVVWPIVTGLVTAVFRKRTAEEYAAMPPRVAAFMRLVGAVGFDAPKALETVRLLLTGGVPKDAPKPPKPPVLPVMLLAFLAGCGGGAAESPDLGKAAALCVTKRTVRQLECVDLYDTKHDIDTCRAKVQAQIDCTDAGTLAAFADAGWQ